MLLERVTPDIDLVRRDPKGDMLLTRSVVRRVQRHRPTPGKEQEHLPRPHAQRRRPLRRQQDRKSAFDMAARFHGSIADKGLDGAAFLGDWIRIGEEEARHFGLIEARLADYGAAYGDLPAHDGLWEAAEATAHDALARLAIAPMVLEARGLDVTPGMIDRLTGAGDQKSAGVLQTIYDDEIGHVRAGEKWFHAICMANGEEPTAMFRALRARYFAGALKPPFNHAARAAAGMDRAYYEDDVGNGPD